MISNLPEENLFKNSTIDGWTLKAEKGRGKIGVVYYAEKKRAEDTIQKAAIKIIPVANLKKGWEIEIKKVLNLQGLEHVVQYYDSNNIILQDEKYIYIIWEYIDGKNLKEYIDENEDNITLSFIRNFIQIMLEVFYAMKSQNIIHGDIHEGNIMISNPDQRRIQKTPIIKITDFGIGGSRNSLIPKDDYTQLAHICKNLLLKIDPAYQNDTNDKLFYSYMVQDFLPKKLLECNCSAGEFVKNPEMLLEIFSNEYNNIISQLFSPNSPQELSNPFDYLSCEQLGDSFNLLQKLYSQNFPGYNDLTQRINTILTGPRGCGKSTIFKNLSLKTKLLASDNRLAEVLKDNIGIYYHCRDLFLSFHFKKGKISKNDSKVLIDYFNISILKEIFDTLIIADSFSDNKISEKSINPIEKFIKINFIKYTTPPQGTDILRHILAFLDNQKNSIGRALITNDRPHRFNSNIKMIPECCDILRENIPWAFNKVFFFFLDDYSHPHISEDMQKVLNDIILYRWEHCFFKISTESITTFFPYDSMNKLLEETREYDVIDLGSHFLREENNRGSFLLEVINNRLINTPSVFPKNHNIINILGDSSFKSYNALARMIRDKSRVHYHGFNSIADMFSGDIADILRLIRNIFTTANIHDKLDTDIPGMPIKSDFQDTAIREYGASFLNRIQAAPETGNTLKRIAESFGKAAHWTLLNVDSKNVKSSPPKQAFRIEIRDTFSFDDKTILKDIYDDLVPKTKQKMIPLSSFISKVHTIYNELLRYSVFLRDVRGKSQRGAVVPRLYLRRLLIPTFVLTPSQRDHIGLEMSEFISLLWDPDNFLEIIKSKKKPPAPPQGRLL